MKNLTGLNLEFSFYYTGYHTKVKEPSLSNPFVKVLEPCEMQTASGRIWTLVTVFISYGDNNNNTHASIIFLR